MGLVAALFGALGILPRTSIGVLIVCIFWLKGARDSQAGDLHHREYMWVHALGILMLSKCGLSYAIVSTRGRVTAPWEARWPLRLVQVYVALFFLAAGLAKLRVTGIDWLDGDTLRGLFIARSVREGYNPADPGWWLAQQPMLCSALSVAAVAMELGFPLTLLARNNSPWLLAFLGVVVLFHAANMRLASVEFLSTSVLLLAFVDLSPMLQKLERAAARKRDQRPDGLL